MSETSIESTGERDLPVVVTHTNGTSAPAVLVYIVLPLIFLTVTLLGGLRINAADHAFIFLPPPLICLVLTAVLAVLLFRARLISIDKWFSVQEGSISNLANGAVVLTLFAAAAQVFNSLLPEQGLPFWIVGFCFVWSLGNNLFSTFDATRLLKSLGVLFGIAFVAKYLVLANLIAPGEGNWLQRIFANPGKEAFTWLLDLPQYSPLTGYIQFFTLLLFLLGLFLTPDAVYRTARRRSRADISDQAD